MYNIIPLILILASLIVIIVIVSKKFSFLATLDVENIPAEKEAKFKEQIIGTRLKRNIVKWLAKFARLINPLTTYLNNFFGWAYKKIQNLKNDYQKSEIKVENIKLIIDQLFNEAEELKKQNDLLEAEKKYIKIIGLDSRNIMAFKELGHLYFEQKSLEEAKQAFEHVLKLKQDDEDVYENLAQIAKESGDLNQAKEDYIKSLKMNKQNAQTFYNLALVYQAMNSLKEAVKSLKKALEIEPNHPRYLDTMLQLSIIIKDKHLALNVCNKLIEVNPENKKIELFKKQIEEL
ncbi:MAG: tetratricopeptide repeat protein [Patescibacteria group bacterium]|nr:tetratricopeptide repeat protein [Patescibacteria group bacterium]MBU1870712.1 tetratricopeptide repeat protein [Patescibacteria group bacterium]